MLYKEGRLLREEKEEEEKEEEEKKKNLYRGISTVTLMLVLPLYLKEMRFDKEKKESFVQNDPKRIGAWRTLYDHVSSEKDHMLLEWKNIC